MIQQDLSRLYPEYSFFWQEKVQEILNNILFIWSKENPIPSYRQGMHELLAVVFLVLHRERKPSPLESSSLNECSSSEVLNSGLSSDHSQVNDADDGFSLIFDERFLESDCFTIFERIMSRMKDFYLVHESPTSRSYRREGGDSGKHPLLESNEDDDTFSVCVMIL